MEPNLADVEALRRNLEDRVTKLRQSLQTWRTWEAEYEGLKEELQVVEGQPSSDDLLSLARNFGGSLIDEKEMQGLLYDSAKELRTTNQIVGVLSRRSDYVRRNVDSVEKQLYLTEKRLGGLLPVEGPASQSEDASERMEIVEELDDKGRVVSSTTSDTAKTAAEVLRSLEKAGVSGAQDQHGPGEAASSNAGTDVSTTINGSANAWAAKPQKSALRYKNSADATGAAPQESQPRQKEKKSVRFSEDTKEPATPSQTLSSSPRSTRSRVPKGAGRKARKQPRRHDTESRTTGSELKDMVVPNDESSEDAQLRRDMLRYSLSEVGAVVAELDLLDDQKASVTADDDDVLKQIHGDEGSSADEWTDEDDLDGSEHGDDDEDEEDIYGRSTRRTLSTAYRKEMEALQRRIEARDIQNMGPAGVGLTSTEQGDRSGQVAVGSKRHEDVGRTASPPSDTKTKATATKGRKAKVLSDTIVEHAPAESQHDEDANDAVEAAHSGPKTPVSAAAAAAALMAPSLGPDPLDPALLQQEVAAEYNRMRNRMIYRQGGFLAKGDDEVGLSIRSGDGGDGEVLEQRVPLDPTAEDDDDDDDDDNDNHGDGDIGGIGAGAAPRRNRKMSRFKAARLRQ